MNMLLKLVSIIILVVAPQLSFGASFSGTVGMVKVSLGSNNVVFGLRKIDKSALSCNGAKRFSFDPSDVGGERVYAALLDAQAHKKIVKVITNDASPCTAGGKQAIKSIAVGYSDEDEAQAREKIRLLLGTGTGNKPPAQN